MLNVEIHPIKEFYEIAEEADLGDCAAVLMSSYEFRTEKLLGVGRILLLNFDDVAEGGSPGAFGTEFASRIKDFVLGLPPQTDTLFCCCDYGESRSAAVAAAVMRRLGQNELKIWRNPKYRPNWLVYGVLCGELGVPVRDEELAEKINLNENAFKKLKEQGRAML